MGRGVTAPSHTKERGGHIQIIPVEVKHSSRRLTPFSEEEKNKIR